ncbi:MAG: PQQ-binding-like beta-propeller repeat protein [Phycisphaerales bacterium]
MYHDRLPASLQRATASSIGALLLAASLGAGSAAAQQPTPSGGASLEDVPQQRAVAVSAGDWLSWRGPHQTAVSDDTRLPTTIEVDDTMQAWTYPIRGRGTPVIHNGRLFGIGYEGEGEALEEVLFCLDAKSGKLLWETRERDFLSDVIYDRYSISAPVVDGETGNVYWMSTGGLLGAYSRDGKQLWQVPMQEMFGMLTYPNGRITAPVLDGGMVIVHCMTSSWGAAGPPRNRFLAFDAATGENVWMSSPCGPPKDNPYSYPVFEWRDGERLLYAGTAGGNAVCVNARNGDPVWRFRMSTGGVCASPLLYGDALIVIHARENLDSSELCRMSAIKLGTKPEPGTEAPIEISARTGQELWRNDMGSFSSSPVLVGDRVYGTEDTGELYCVNADTGEVLWHEKLAPDQIHASPVYANGLLYVPMNNGSFHVIRPSDAGMEKVSSTQLAGNCLGAPAIADGRIYVHTTEKLYCFAGEPAGGAVGTPVLAMELQPMPGEPARLQIVPAEVLLSPGEEVSLRIFTLDAAGLRIDNADGGSEVTWSDSPLAIRLTSDSLRAGQDATGGVSVLTATRDGLKGQMRVRIVDEFPYTQDFDNIALTQSDTANADVKFAHPPDEWIQTRLRWDVRELDGNKVLAKTLDNPILQRTISFLGDPRACNYTMQMDILSDGSRRTMSSAGLIVQRYMIALKGNHQELEVSSNQERFKHAVKFSWKPGVWYTLKSRVEVDGQGVATIQAKVWPRDEAEPSEWTIEVTQDNGHTNGAPGLWGFVPQSRFHVYLDSISITSNDNN